MSIVATLGATFNVVETLETNVAFAAASAKAVTHNGLSTARTLNASSSPPGTLVAAFTKALSSGAGTIDLNALTGTNGKTVSLTGLKVRAVILKAKAANANPITVTEGASNGYALLGAGFTFDLKPGYEITIYLASGAPDVASGDKTIDLAGTGSQELDVGIIGG